MKIHNIPMHLYIFSRPECHGCWIAGSSWLGRLQWLIMIYCGFSYMAEVTEKVSHNCSIMCSLKLSCLFLILGSWLSRIIRIIFAARLCHLDNILPISHPLHLALKTSMPLEVQDGGGQMGKQELKKKTVQNIAYHFWKSLWAFTLEFHKFCRIFY